MKILCIGDIVSRAGRDIVFKYVEDLKYSKGIDFVIANGENVSHGNGMMRSAYDELMRAGCDAITLGNHAWGSKEVASIMRLEDNVIRPANFSSSCPGDGSMILTAKNGIKIGIINIIGQTYMTPPAHSPFETVIEEVEKIKEKTNIIMVDFHAEATSEKQTMGFFLDGKVSAVFGTHTHVQTADDYVLPNGTGYISDLGMTGPQLSVLGMEKEIILEKFITGMPQKFRVSQNKGQFCGCIFDINEETGLCNSTERLFIKD